MLRNVMKKNIFLNIALLSFPSFLYLADNPAGATEIARPTLTGVVFIGYGKLPVDETFANVSKFDEMPSACKSVPLIIMSMTPQESIGMRLSYTPEKGGPFDYYEFVGLKFSDATIITPIFDGKVYPRSKYAIRKLPTHKDDSVKCFRIKKGLK